MDLFVCFVACLGDLLIFLFLLVQHMVRQGVNKGDRKDRGRMRMILSLTVPKVFSVCIFYLFMEFPALFYTTCFFSTPTVCVSLVQ